MLYGTLSNTLLGNLLVSKAAGKVYMQVMELCELEKE